jgi:predicted AlkP superfamily pyrophosphatase or phosphodiesterase
MNPRLALLVPCLLLACAADGARPPARHVVLVAVDGLRPDAVTESGTPVLARLLREGAASRASRVPPPWLTLPSHLSMVTGQAPARHGVLTNRTLAREFAGATLFTAVHDAGRRTALYVGKHKLVALAPRGSADVVQAPGAGDSDWELNSSARLAARFAADFPRERFALTLLHLREPDEAGHDAGWMTPPYFAALAEVDRALGAVLRAIADSGLPTTLILTSDHGGEGKEHWKHEALDSIVPWVCVGPGVEAGAAIADSSIADTGPTAAALLGVALPGADGRVVKECL